MGRVPSDEIRYGRHAETGAYRDSRYVRCSRCGFMCHLDRDMRAPYGSHAGEGVTRVTGVNDFTVTGGCPSCGAFTYDQEER
jgi:hypothetical protein